MPTMRIAALLAAALAMSGCFGFGRGKNQGSDATTSTPITQFSTSTNERIPSNKRRPNQGGVATTNNAPELMTSSLFSDSDREEARLEKADRAFENGRSTYSQGNWRAAEGHFRRAIEIDEFEAMYWNWLGLTLHAGGDDVAAVQAYNQALRLLDEYPVSDAHVERQMMRLEAAIQFNKGNSLRDLQQIDEAIYAYEATMAVDPDMPGLTYEIGNLYVKTRQFDQAERMFLLSMRKPPDESDPQRSKTRLGLAILYHLTDRNEQALNYILELEGGGFRVAGDLRQSVVQGAARAREAQRTASLFP